MKKISVKKFVEEFNKIHNTLKHGYIEENLNIVSYIPIEAKQKMAEKIALYTTFVHREVVDENGNITLKRTQEINRDSFIKYMLYCRTLISNYTNLDIETENFYEEYDLLKSSGLLDLIMSSYIPETEIAEFKIILKMKQEDLIFNNNSTHNYVSNQIGRIENLVSTVVNPTIESITNYLNNLDEKDSKRLVSRIDKILGKLDRLVKSSK